MAEAPAVTGSLTLRRVAPDVGQADHRFDAGVDAVEFGPAVIAYRRTARTCLAPEATLVDDDGHEVVRRVLQIEVRLHEACVPMDRQSGGGTAISLGLLMGRVWQDGLARDLSLRARLEGAPTAAAGCSSATCAWAACRTNWPRVR